MDALKGFMLYLEQVRMMLMPVFTQGTAALDPLVKAHPWAFLIGAFVLGVIALTTFRILTGMLMRLILLPVLLVTGYLFFSSGTQVMNLLVPLIQNKFAGI